MRIDKRQLKKYLFSFPLFVMVFSGIGLLASTAISIEKTHLLENPQADLSCSLNPVYSCQGVITSDQASIFGFSNELIGIAFFGGLLALGLAQLTGAKLSKLLHKLVWLGLLASMGMVVWFFRESVYELNALCIYCTTVWFATWALFVRYTNWILQNNVVSIPKKYKSISKWFVIHSIQIWVLVILLFIGLSLEHFWYYYSQYF